MIGPLNWIMLSQRELPSLLRSIRRGNHSREVFQGRVELENIIGLVSGEVIANVLIWYVVRHEGPVGEGRVRVRHGNGRDVRAVGTFDQFMSP